MKMHYVAEFIREVQGDLVPVGHTEGFGTWFSRRGEGSLFLSEGETTTYRQVVSKLLADFVKHKDLSRRSAEQLLQDALFSALDLQNRSSTTFERRLEAALAQLESALRRPSERYTCYVPLGGLAADGLPSRLGDLRLVVLTEAQIRKLARPDPREPPQSHSVRQRRRLLRDLQRTDSWHKAAAIVVVTARDFGAATELARRETRRAIDVLNFFADLVPYANGWVYLPSEAASIKSVAPVLKADGTLAVPFTAEGPVQAFSISKLRAAGFLRASYRRANELMRTQRRSTLASALLSAMEWAGRASFEQRREQAFLLYAIALETLVLPEAETQELLYRLRVRTAHILGRNRAARTRISLHVRDLYRIRSKIVHTGSYEVTDEDLGQLRGIVKGAVLRLLMHRRIRQLATTDQLVEWFEGKTLD